MTMQERIAELETQLTQWRERHAKAAEALQEAQSAILQLTGAIAFARSLDGPDPLAEADIPSVNDEPPERCS